MEKVNVVESILMGKSLDMKIFVALEGVYAKVHDFMMSQSRWGAKAGVDPGMEEI